MSELSAYNESVLLKKIAEGDQVAFAQVFGRYRSNIYTTVFRICGDAQTAEEVLQDVFLKAWINRVSLASSDNFGGWLYRVAENTTLNAIKRLARQRKAEQKAAGFAHLHLPVTHSIDDLLIDKEYNALLHQAVNRLPARQRETWILIREQGLTRQAAADVMQVSAETIKWNLEQATRSVRAFCVSKLNIIPLFILFFPGWKNLF